MTNDLMGFLTFINYSEPPNVWEEFYLNKQFFFIIYYGFVSTFVSTYIYIYLYISFLTYF